MNDEERRPRLLVFIVAYEAEATIEQAGWDLFRYLLEVASGERHTWAEKWRLHNSLALFNPAPIT